MSKLPLQRESIEPRMDGIQKDLKLLKEFARLSFQDFNTPIILDRTQLHLRFALEGIFHIAGHVLSRIPGGRYTEYKELARKMGEVGIVTMPFAEEKLILMAGYRNRLTHFYAEITPHELHTILRDHLGDIEEFLRAVRQVMEHPEKFDLTIS